MTVQGNAKYSGTISHLDKSHKMHHGSNQSLRNRYLKE